MDLHAARQRLAAWEEVERTGDLSVEGARRRQLLGALAGRWHQVLAVEVDLPLDTLPPGGERLEALSLAWLDVARRTAPVRALLRREDVGTDTRLRSLFVSLLGDDLAALGAPSPLRSAADLLAQLEAVADLEERAGRALRRERRALLRGLGAPERATARRLVPLRRRLAPA